MSNKLFHTISRLKKINQFLSLYSNRKIKFSYMINIDFVIEVQTKMMDDCNRITYLVQII